MVGTICFAVRDASRSDRRLWNASSFLLAAAVSGVLFAFTLLAVSYFWSVPTPAAVATVIVLAGYAALRESRLVRLPVIGWPRQVPRAWWRRDRQAVTAFAWGLL